MKELLSVISLLVAGAVAEPPAPYPASGWRPNGPAFELPERSPTGPGQTQEYLPPADSNQLNIPTTSYGTPDYDVSVQGLPTQEQVPVFQVSPINGLQYVGPNFNSDIKKFDTDSFRQTQFQIQQEKQRQFDRQRQLNAAQNNFGSNFPNQPVPRQFASTTTSTAATFTTPKPTSKTTQSSITESDLNEGETLDDDNEQKKVSVEVSKQNIQEFPPELFLNPLAQLKLQPQFAPLQQLGQIRAPVYFQPQLAQQQASAGFDGPTHFAALPSVLAQQKGALQVQRFQNPTIVQQPLISSNQQPLTQYQPLDQQIQISQFSAQPVVVQPQAVNQLQPEYGQPKQQEDNEDDDQDQSQVYPRPQQVFQQQPQVFQQQPQQVYQQEPQQVFQQQPQQVFQQQPQQVYQQQPQFVQPQQVYQEQPNQFGQSPQAYQPQSQQVYQPQPQQVYQQQQPFGQQQFVQTQQFQPNQDQIVQAQLIRYPAQNLNQYYQLLQQQQLEQGQQVQGQDSLQSGLDVNQQGNDIEQTEDNSDDEQDDGSTATAVATAFGARTQPRVFSQYGAPVPVPRAQADPGYQTTETNVEAVNEEGSTAEAVAVARGGRRKSAKLRSRRVRPVFTLDRSGHLVLSQEQ